MLRFESWSLVFLAAASIRPAEGACFFRNGTQTTSDYTPCSLDPTAALSTVCCASWDTCLPNGLCQSSIDKLFWRETCTKQKWDDGGCQELCSKDREAQVNNNIMVTPCSGNATSLEWCCGKSSDCCNSGSDLPKYTIARKFGDPIPTPSASSSTIMVSSTVTAPASSTSNTAPRASQSAAPASGLSAGAKAGVGIGASIGVIALIASGIFVWKAMQWRKMAAAAAPPYEMPEQYVQPEVYKYEKDVKPAQLPGMESTVHEMAGSPGASEIAVPPSRHSRNK